MDDRLICHLYEDPLERIWKACAKNLGFEVLRSRDTFASYDGKGTILISIKEDMDPDDHLGQMIFHELCHALVEGDAGERQVDWGLDNRRNGNPWREHACLRTQAWISDQFGLRDFMAPTTLYRREFWAQLPEDPLSPIEGCDPRSLVSSRLAIGRYHSPRWHSPISQALEMTSRIGEVLSAQLPVQSQENPSLWAVVKKRPPMHPLGRAAIVDGSSQKSCRECAWAIFRRTRMECRHSPGKSLCGSFSACTRYEPRKDLNCESCGACCREAYDTVEIRPRDPVKKIHPELVMQRDHRWVLLREGGRCAALAGGTHSDPLYSCRIYSERPRTCRDFDFGGIHCLEARKKVGLSI